MAVAIGHAQTVSPRRLLDVADFGHPVVSPDGRRVAFRTERASIERNTYDSVWYVQSLDGTSPPHPVAEGGVPLRDSAGVSMPAEPVWSPDARWIYYRALIDGRIDVWRAAVDGSGAKPITLDTADVRDFSLSADGQTLRYSVGASRMEVEEAEQVEYDKGIRIDERVPVGQGLFRSGYVNGRLETQRYGKVWFDRAPLLADVADRRKVLDLATGRTRDDASLESVSTSKSTSGPQGADNPWVIARDPDRDRVAVLVRVGPKGALRDSLDVELSMRFDSHARASVRCRATMCTRQPITAIQWQPNSDEVLFTVTDRNEGFAQSIYRWNVETGRVHLVVHAAGLLNGGRDISSPCGLSSRVLVCVAAGANQPPRLERVDLKTGERRVLFDPNEALAIDMAATVSVRMLRWTDAQGRSFTGPLFRARRKGAVPAPLFVTYYDCPGFLRGGFGDEWPLATLAEQGISTLCINRLPGFALDAVERHVQGTGAVQSAIDLLSSDGEVDRTKVGMGGLSYGGAVTMWTVTESRLLAAASVSSPVVSPMYYLTGSLKGRAFTTGLREMWGLGSPEETPERWRIMSPLFKLDRVAAPVLFQMPEQEYLQSVDYLVPLLREHRADLYVFPNEPHQKFQPRHKLAVYERNLDWFRFWLQGYEDPDAGKRSQYVSWRTMKDGVNIQR